MTFKMINKREVIYVIVCVPLLKGAVKNITEQHVFFHSLGSKN